MLGRVAVAPAGEEEFGGLWPGRFGGNMDNEDVREGTTVYLPVAHDGGLFYFCDGHALQGDGELCGSGLETSMEVSFRFGLIKGKPIAWPRLEDREHIMVAGSARPLSDALRIAGASDKIDLLLTDFSLRNGSGDTLAAKLRALDPALPVLFLSGWRPDQEPALEVALEHPRTAFLAKPAELDDIEKVIPFA